MAHYYSVEQDSPLELSRITERVLGLSISLSVGSGVFSKEHIDAGTRVLIEHCIMRDGWKVLDFGCGYGAIGIAIAKRFPHAQVLMVDVNKRALRLAAMNLKLNGITNATVRESDCFSAVPERFDTILVNPPMSAGRALCFRMVDEAREHLVPGGLFQLVAKHRKGGEMLGKRMQEAYGNLEILARSAGYRLYLSKNSNAT